MKKLFLFLILLSSNAYPCQFQNPDRSDLESFIEKIADFEFGGTYEGITMWNKGETFPSLGLGHYLWFPTNDRPYEESFPKVIKYLVNVAKIPRVEIPQVIRLDAQGNIINKAPWKTREQFYNEFYSPKLVELRAFLNRKDILYHQGLYQLEGLRKNLVSIKNSLGQSKFFCKFTKSLGASSRGLFALFDYINFKGTGLNPKERVQDKTDPRKKYGWGLKQVILDYKPSQSMREIDRFKNGALYVLKRRIKHETNPHAPRWWAGWSKRVNSY